MVSSANVEYCSLAAGEGVRHENIMAVSRMNSAVVLFLNIVERANELAEKDIVIGGSRTNVLPLSTPSQKVTLLNISRFIKDDTLATELYRHGKLISLIKNITVGRKSDLVKHVVSQNIRRHDPEQQQHCVRAHINC